MFISLLSISEKLFGKNLITIFNILKNKIKVIILVNDYITWYGYINKKFLEIIYKIFKIKS